MPEKRRIGTAVRDHEGSQESPLAPQWNVQTLMEMHLSFAPARILSTALELDIFTPLAAGARTAAAVAEAVGATERGTRMLLDALAGTGLLNKQRNRYSLTETARLHLLKESPAYTGEFLRINPLWDSWGHLTEAVRTGRPYLPVEQEDVAAEFFPKLIRGLHVVHAEPARRAAVALGAGTRHRGMRVLDVACGSAIWSIKIAEADPGAHVTALDFPAVLESTREYAKRHGVSDRFDYQAGDLKKLDLGENRYDLAILGNIVHSEGEQSSRDLIRRAYRALAPGGRIAIVEMIPNDERSGPPFALVFALNMLVNTEAGDTYTLAEFDHWLREAGFQGVETADIGSHSPLVVAHKPKV